MRASDGSKLRLQTLTAKNIPSTNIQGQVQDTANQDY